ncbi:MAG: glutamate racemase [Rikenellaceae bacterium]
MDNRPIGVFDSGLGGLSVYRVLRESLPHESFAYFGDGKNCPYGDKSLEQIIEYVDEAVEVLLKRDIKMLVVACNAATAMTIEYLRGKYDFHIVGMEPAVKPAAETTKTGVVGVLATSATLKGELFKQTCQRYSLKAKIIPTVGEGFVEVVENGNENSPEAENLVAKAMKEMLEMGADKIVLGCTHYPFLSETILKVIGTRDIEIIDPAPAITKRVKQLLSENNLFAHENNKATTEFFTASDENYRQKLINKATKWHK